MRVAIVKQLLDTIGPWTSVLWKNTSPREIFELWPGKGLHWEMTTLFQTDWYVVPQQLNTDYTYDSILRHPAHAKILEKYTSGVVSPAEIPFDDYDIIIALDPILEFPAGSDTLFAYFVTEHWDRRYRRSLRRPLGNADLFLDHMMSAAPKLSRLPQAVAFPYVRDPGTMRSFFASAVREDSIWVDWRTFATLGCAGNGNGHAAISDIAERLQETLGLPVACRSFAAGLYHAEDPPRWGDAAAYLSELGRKKYYLCLGRASGAGQGLADAASLACICFGEQDKPYHRLICHPEALCGDLQDLPRRVWRVRASRDLQREILAWQDEKLHRYFVKEPLELLEEALQMKRGSAANKRPVDSCRRDQSDRRAAVAG